MNALKVWFNSSFFKGSALSFGCFFLSGLSLAIYLYFPSFDSWYLREDSRFFSVAPFSLYDLFDAFATPFNSMGQYRPITKVLWSLPVWLGLQIPFSYHLLSFGLLILAGLALARIQFKLYPSAAASGLAFCIYILLPIHQKIMYWISAWHNIAAATFFFLCLAIRFDLQKEGRSILRALSLLFLFLGIASREIVFAVVPLILAVDYFYCGRRLRNSVDVIGLTAFLFFFLFVLASPFQVAKVKLAEESILSLSWILEISNQIATNTFWSAGDAFHPILVGWHRAIAYMVGASAVVGFFFRRFFLLPLGMTILGVIPFLAIGSVNIEYLIIFAGGLVLGATSLIALGMGKLSKKISILAGFGLLLLPFGFVYELLPTRQLYAGYYRTESHLVRDFVRAFSDFSAQTEPNQFIEIVDFGSYVESSANMSHHFLILGLDHLVPRHYSLFRNESLNINDGTGLKDLHDARAYWKGVAPLLMPPLKVRYRADKFEAIHD